MKNIVKIIFSLNIVLFFLGCEQKEHPDKIETELEVHSKYSSKATVLNENREVDIVNGFIKDEFKPLDVYIYKLKNRQ